jgi:hypothetical protein
MWAWGLMTLLLMSRSFGVFSLVGELVRAGYVWAVVLGFMAAVRVR